MYDQKDELFIASPTWPTYAELYKKRVEEVHIYQMIHASCLWLRKGNYTFAMAKYNDSQRI